MVNAKTWNPAQIDQAIRRLEGIIRSGSYNPAELNQLLNQLGEPGYINTWNPAELDQKLRTLLHDLLSWKTATGNPIQLRTNNGGLVQSCEVTFSPIQSGSGDPSPTNIRPISGWDSLSLTRTGKNLFDEIYTDISGTVRYKQIKVGNGTFTFSTDCPKNSDNASNLFALSGYATSGGSTATNGLWEGKTRTVTTNDGYVTIAYRQTVVNNPANYHTQIEIGSTATSYEPYQGQTYTATFPDTVYGGNYEFVSGKLAINKIIKLVSDGEWTAGSNNTFYATSFTDKKVGNFNLISSNYKTSTSGSVANMPDLSIKGDATESYIYIRDTNYLTKEDFVTNVGSCEIVYELATPIEITLTPEEIELLTGYNVLWTDGDSIEITYKKLLLPSDVELLSKNKKIKEKPKTTRSKKKKEE